MHEALLWKKTESPSSYWFLFAHLSKSFFLVHPKGKCCAHKLRTSDTVLLFTKLCWSVRSLVRPLIRPLVCPTISGRCQDGKQLISRKWICSDNTSHKTSSIFKKYESFGQEILFWEILDVARLSGLIRLKVINKNINFSLKIVLTNTLNEEIS